MGRQLTSTHKFNCHRQTHKWTSKLTDGKTDRQVSLNKFTLEIMEFSGRYNTIYHITNLVFNLHLSNKCMLDM